MHALRLRLREPLSRELVLAGACALGTLLLAYAGAHKLGIDALLLPLGVVLLAILMRYPVAMLTATTAAVILGEGPTFGLFGFTSHLYGHIYRELTPVDFLVALTVVSIGLDIMRKRRTVSMPRPMAFALILLALAMIAGAITGHAAGLGLRSVLLGEDVLAYLLLLPVAVANLDLSPRRVQMLLLGAVGLAVLKAILGLVEIASHKGAPIEGSSTLTYYEPTANWLIMIRSAGRGRRDRGADASAALDDPEQPAAARFAAALLPTLVLDRRGAGPDTRRAVQHLAGRPAPADSGRPAAGRLHLATRIGALAELAVSGGATDRLAQPVQS